MKPHGKMGKRLRLSALIVSAGVSAGVAASLPARAATFDCVMEPAQKVKIGSSVTGVLKSVLVARGDTVEAGQEIAKLDSSVETASVALAKLQASSVEGIEAQRSRLKLVRSKLGRTEPLAVKGISTQERLDEQRAEADIAERDLNTEMMKQNLARIDQQRAEAVLDLRTIRSPLTGLVLDKNLSAGEFVNQEAFIMTLVQIDPLFVEAYVPVAYWGKVTKGLTATVRPAAPVGGSYPAPVTVVDGVFDAASGTFGVRLELKNPGNALPGGVRCKVDFDIETIPPQPMADGRPEARPRLNEEATNDRPKGTQLGRP
jgi:RND family efflux transporter MFP subunit